MTTKRTLVLSALLAVTATLFINASPVYAKGKPVSAEAKRVIDHWTPERRAAAIPRDLVIDARGLGYLRKPDGSLQPYGHSVRAQLSASKQTPLARPSNPGGGDKSDTTSPAISNMVPADGAVIGSNQTFSATVTDDASGIKSVTFVVTYPDGVTTQSFNAGNAGGDTWETTLQGFSDGNWSWQVVAKDNGAKGGNSATSESVNFTVDTSSSSSDGGGGGGGSYITTNAGWDAGGAVQTAAGRIYFQMPGNPKRKRWLGYVCSGTVSTDSTMSRSVIITAAHCVYDDANKAFARNVLFIPNQDGTTGSGTDTNCSNDPMGCWAPAFGVVDVDWTSRTFPDNIPWDYAYYVVSDSGAHSGTAASSDALDTAAGSMAVSFMAPAPYVDDGDPSATSVDFTHALGYSYSDDPNFMYCAEDMTTEGTANWWLASCDLSGGSSGGPWVQPMNTVTGNGPIISVNSWGYTTSSGMAGPMLVGTSAECVFTIAKTENFAGVPDTDGDAGVAVSCP